MSMPTAKVTKRSTGGCCDRYCCFSCICIVCFVTIPIILVIIAVAAIYAIGNRSGKIAKYNNHVLRYDNSTYDGLSLSVNGVALSMTSVSTFPNYPTGDTCKLEGDPKEGCYNWPSKVYVANIPVDSATTKFILKNESTGAVISEQNANYKDIQILDQTALGCDSTSTCAHECERRGGVYTNNRCEVTGYLSNGCIRVIKEGNNVAVDVEGKLLSKLMRMLGGQGCDVSNGLSVVAREQRPATTVPFLVRDYRDPYILAQDLTFGCPLFSDNPTKCFGITDAEASTAAAAFIVPVVIYSAVVMIISCGVCALIRKAARNNRATGGTGANSQFMAPVGNQASAYYPQPAYNAPRAY